MILAIERDARDAKNECGSARALLSAARDAPGDLAPRLRKRLRAQVAPALASSQPDCLVDVAALLVPLLPDGDKRAVIGDLAQLYEKGLNGWGLYRAVMPAIAPHLTNVLRALPSSSTPVYAARVRADIAASPDADSRIDAAALVLDALAGLRRR
jgi:hypothetical protein